MANYASLKNIIDQAITTNGMQDITGAILNETLKAMVSSLGAGYEYGGIASPALNPGSPDQNLFYIACDEGTYTYMGGFTLPNGISLIKWNGSWGAEVLANWNLIGSIESIDTTNADLEFSDESYNILVKFAGGHVQTKNFNSAAVTQKLGTIEEGAEVNNVDTESVVDNSDLEFSDENNNILVQFENGNVQTKNFNSATVTQKLGTIEEGAEVNDVDTDNSQESSDLDFTDGEGNILVRFEDGNVQTKNFNSAEFTRKPFAGKSFSILGDSISTFQGYLRSDEAGYDGTAYAYYYPRTYLNNVNETWWKKLEALTGLQLMQNCAWSGSQVCGNSQSTTSAQAGCSTRRVTDLKKNGVDPDIILIFIGVNDLRNSDSRALGNWTGNDEIVAESTNVATFSAAYSLMVSKVMTAYPHSEIYCCTILDTGHSSFDTHDIAKYPCKNDRGNTTKEWNDTIRMVAESLGAKVLDMHACGIDFFNLNTYTGDRLHPNASGATLMAKQAAKELVSKSRFTFK